MTTLKNIVVAFASIVIFTNITHAQAVKTSYSVNYEEPLAVKYIGTDGEYLLFQVTVKSEAPVYRSLVITDENEGELYSSNIRPALSVKTVKIEKRSDQVLNFKLTVGRKAYSKSFTVNTNRIETTTVAENSITLR
jgi:hypothetical protein